MLINLIICHSKETKHGRLLNRPTGIIVVATFNDYGNDSKQQKNRPTRMAPYGSSNVNVFNNG